jgi:hypothetical protein
LPGIVALRPAIVTPLAAIVAPGVAIVAPLAAIVAPGTVTARLVLIGTLALVCGLPPVRGLALVRRPALSRHYILLALALLPAIAGRVDGRLVGLGVPPFHAAQITAALRRRRCSARGCGCRSGASSLLLMRRAVTVAIAVVLVLLGKCGAGQRQQHGTKCQTAQPCRNSTAHLCSYCNGHDRFSISRRAGLRGFMTIQLAQSQ